MPAWPLLVPDDIVVALAPLLPELDDDDELLWVGPGILVDEVLLELAEDDEGSRHCE